MNSSQLLSSTIIRCIIIAVLCFPYGLTHAEKALIAVASNALLATKALKVVFENNSTHQLIISSGSTGKLYTQIINGAPFDVFLAANEREPKKLEQQKLIVNDSRFTYAQGKIVLYSASIRLGELNSKTVLRNAKYRKLAIANPKTAPYGAAAKQILENLGLWQKLNAKIVRGENITQTFQFVATGNAELGFVALPQILAAKVDKSNYWLVPKDLYNSLNQQAVLLIRARHNPAAIAFFEFLHGEQARKLLSENFGYEFDDEK